VREAYSSVVDDDWRLHGQEYLQGVTLHRRRYFLWRSDWDHDHCAFCWKTFLLPGAPLEADQVSEGWTTDDEYHWLCDECFGDFKQRFQWKVRDPLPNDHPDTHWPQSTINPEGEVKK
jgi:hypothetical protein